MWQPAGLPGMSRQPRVILLVEDSEDDADLTLRAFHTSGVDCKIDVVRDGKAALDYVFAHGSTDGRDGRPSPTLILLDLKLPRVSGLEVLRQLRLSASCRRVPVVVMSCSTENADIAASLELGANSYVRKPVDFLEFTRAVELIGRYWLDLNQSAGAEVGRP
jgi:two-component system response regulator